MLSLYEDLFGFIIRDVKQIEYYYSYLAGRLASIRCK